MYLGSGLFPGKHPSKNPSILDFTSQRTPRVPARQRERSDGGSGPSWDPRDWGTQNAHPLSSAWKLLSFLEDLTTWSPPSLLSWGSHPRISGKIKVTGKADGSRALPDDDDKEGGQANLPLGKCPPPGVIPTEGELPEPPRNSHSTSFLHNWWHRSCPPGQRGG